MKPKTVYLTVNGVKLKILLRRGNNPNIILLHGMPGQMSNWKHVLRLLETKNYAVVVPDMKGYEGSEKPEKVSIDDYVEDLRGLMESLDLDPSMTLVAGHSFGCVVAMEYIVKYNDIPATLLVGPPYELKMDLMDKIVVHTPHLFWKPLFFKNNPLTRRFYRKLFFSPKTPYKIFQDFMKDNTKYIESLPAHVFRYSRFFDGWRAPEKLREARVKAEIIVGRDDIITPPEAAEKINGLIPGSKLIVVEDAGHMILYEKPDVVASSIIRLVNSI